MLLQHQVESYARCLTHMEHMSEECASIRGEMESESSGNVSALREARQLEADISTSKAAFVEALNRCAGQEARLREMIKPFEAHQAESRAQLDQVRLILVLVLYTVQVYSIDCRLLWFAL